MLIELMALLIQVDMDELVTVEATTYIEGTFEVEGRAILEDLFGEDLSEIFE